MNKYNLGLFNLILITLIITSALFLINCSDGNSGSQDDIKELKNSFIKEKDNHGHEKEEENSFVQLTDKELKEFKINIEKVGVSVIQEHIHLTGEIIPDPRRIAHIKPRFAGIVKEVYKTIGDRVKKGEIIAVIEANESLVNYKIKSSIKGTVIDMHMTIGESAGDDSHNIIIADLSTVWGKFNIYQRDLSSIRKNQSVLISTMGETFNNSGTISYISPVIDEKTRTASARVLLKNKNGNWKPGMFVTAKVLTIEKEVPLAVNKTALQHYKGQTVVFVREKKGFRPQVVSIGLQNDKNAEIISGLYEGQEYVVSGAFMIKAELEKESFGDGHGH